MTRNKTEFAVLPAFHGDCILIKTFDQDNNDFNILIDGGTAQTFRYSLKEQLQNLTKINLIVLTHIDSDHIAGLISFFKSSLIGTLAIDEIWMNHPEIIEVDSGEQISIKQGNSLLDLIKTIIPQVKIVQMSTDVDMIFRSGIKFQILSPTPAIKKELLKRWQSQTDLDELSSQERISSNVDNYSIPLTNLNQVPFSPDKNVYEDIYNSSSISFILTCPDVSILLLADSRAEIIQQSLNNLGFTNSNPLIVDYVKVSHHGSINNTSQDLLGLITSTNYIISTNGGTADHKHPSREVIARIIYNSNRSDEKITIYFNHSLEQIRDRIGNFINEEDFATGNWIAKSQNWF